MLKKSKVDEAFGCGTVEVISPVGIIGIAGQDYPTKDAKNVGLGVMWFLVSALGYFSCKGFHHIRTNTRIYKYLYLSPL